MRRALRALQNARLFAARYLPALGLTLATLAGAAPAGGAYAAGACPMPCCRARERADCPACHHKRLKKAAARASDSHDAVCGARFELGRGARRVLAAQDLTRRDASADAGSAHAPCKSDCCGLLASFTHQKRGRDEAVVSHAVRPPPPHVLARANHTRRADANTSELCPRCSPRAPPATRRPV